MIPINDRLTDPSALDWLKQALRSALDRDCVDAAFIGPRVWRKPPEAIAIMLHGNGR